MAFTPLLDSVARSFSGYALTPAKPSSQSIGCGQTATNSWGKSQSSQVAISKPHWCLTIDLWVTVVGLLNYSRLIQVEPLFELQLLIREMQPFMVLQSMCCPTKSSTPSYGDSSIARHGYSLTASCTPLFLCAPLYYKM